MKIKLLMGLLTFILSINSLSTEWKYQGGLDGGAGLMIVYKSVPPIKIEVEEPEIMVVPRGTQLFKYTEASRKKEPLAVKIEIQFDSSIVQDNGVNKQIITQMYNSAKLWFDNNGYFEMIDSNGVIPKANNQENSRSIKAEAFFVDKNKANEKKETIINFKETIQNGLLVSDKAYIDAKFNTEGKEMLSGNYRGVAKLNIEILGKNGGGQ